MTGETQGGDGEGAGGGNVGGGTPQDKEKSMVGPVVIPGPTVPVLTREAAQRSTSRAKFYGEYERYCEDVKSYAATAGGTVHQSALKSCINADALRTALLARSLRKVDKSACADMSEVTDDILKSWLCPKEKKAMLISAGNLADVFKKLSWRWSDSCYEDATVSYTERFMSALSDQNLESCLKESRLQKELVTLYISKIAPAALHDPLEADSTRDKELKYDFVESD